VRRGHSPEMSLPRVASLGSAPPAAPLSRNRRGGLLGCCALPPSTRREKCAGLKTSSDFFLSVANSGSSSVGSEFAKPDAFFAPHTIPVEAALYAAAASLPRSSLWPPPPGDEPREATRGSVTPSRRRSRSRLPALQAGGLCHGSIYDRQRGRFSKDEKRPLCSSVICKRHRNYLT
jgi:hypothetical protein